MYDHCLETWLVRGHAAFISILLISGSPLDLSTQPISHSLYDGRSFGMMAVAPATHDDRRLSKRPLLARHDVARHPWCGLMRVGSRPIKRLEIIRYTATITTRDTLELLVFLSSSNATARRGETSG
jgi:hypothetical protein